MQWGWYGYGAQPGRSKAAIRIVPIIAALAVALLLVPRPGAAQDSTGAQAAPVVVAFGDSLTQGYGLAEAQGFVPQLAAWLAENGVEATVVNAGVSGDTTAGGAARIDWTLTPEVDAVIVALGGNDLLRGLDPAVSRANLERIVGAAVARDLKVLLVGMQAPGNFGAAYKQDFDAMYPEIAARFGTAFVPSFFLGFAPDGAELDPAQVQHWMQPDGIHPNAEGVSLIVSALGPYVAQLLTP